MNAREMRQLSAEELQARVGEWEEDLFRERCNKVIGQAMNTAKISIIRRQIARGKTIIKEMERDAASQG